jgi:hypothetical protein
MWYNDLLLILMGFVGLLLIVLAIMVLNTRSRKPPIVIEREQEPEKIFVEKGFEKRKDDETIDTSPEIDPDSSEIEQEISEPEEPTIEEPIEIEQLSVAESEEITEEIVQEEPESNQVDLTEEPDQMLEDDQTGTPQIDEDVIITPNQTFYDPIIEESSEESVELMETESEISDANIPETDISGVELTPIEVSPVTEDIGLELEESIPELETPTIETLDAEVRSRIRKPIIDESDPDLKIDLGVEICPHCGSNVPDTIYCIYCGKALSPDNSETSEE